MAKSDPTSSSVPLLVEGVDYYLENEYWVFTAHYLRQRGYCCGSGCRHCPYRKAHLPEKEPKVNDRL